MPAPTTATKPASRTFPDALGRFGAFGGRFVPETLMDALDKLAIAYDEARADPEFQKELEFYWTHYVGRPSPLFHAQRLSKKAGGAEIHLKREDLNHTGAHKINNAIGQVLLARRMRKKRVIAETGAGQHGVATATACACSVSIAPSTWARKTSADRSSTSSTCALSGATLIGVSTGSRTLRDATNEALRDWMGSSSETHYTIGSVVGPHPFPMIVRDFQSIIGRETRHQCLAQLGRLPNAVVACVGGGSNAAGIFYPLIEDSSVELIGAEAGGRGQSAGEHAASLSKVVPASCTAASVTSFKTTTARRSTSIRSPPASTIPASVRSTAIGKIPAASAMNPSPTLRLLKPITHWPVSKASSPRRIEPRRRSSLEGSPATRLRQDPRRLPLRPRRQRCLRIARLEESRSREAAAREQNHHPRLLSRS